MFKTVMVIVLLVVKLSVSAMDCPSSYRAKTATEYSVRDASSCRSYEVTGPRSTCRTHNNMIEKKQETLFFCF